MKKFLTSYRLWIAVVFVFAVCYRLWDLDSTPVGYQIDEMGSAYDAWCLLHYGVDRYQISWPVYFINFGGGQNALYTYLLVPSIALFGFTRFAIRLPAVLNSILLGACGLGIIGLIWNRMCGIQKEAAQLLFIILYAIAPYTQMAGRLGLESLLMLGMSTTFLYTFLLALDHTRKRTRRHALLWVLSGIVGGLTLYTYAISYLVLPLFLVAALAYLIYVGKVRLVRKDSRLAANTVESEGTIVFSDILLFVVPLTALAMPLVLEQIVNMTGGESFRIFGIFTVTNLGFYRGSEFTASNLWNNLILTFESALGYDWLDYSTTSDYWTFYAVSIPFFFIGFGVAFHRLMESLRERRLDPYAMCVLWFFAQLAICCLLGEEGQTSVNPNTNKINGIFFTVMLFIVTGYAYCFRGIQNIRWKQWTAAMLAAFYLVAFVKFTDFYFNDFAPSSIWKDEYSDLLSFIDEDEDLSQKTIFVNEAGYIYYLASALPSPYEIDVENGRYGADTIRWEMDIADIKSEILNASGTEANYIIWDFYSYGSEWAQELLDVGFETRDYGR